MARQVLITLYTTTLNRIGEPILISKVTECICFQEIVSLVYYWVLILIINTCAPNYIV